MNDRRRSELALALDDFKLATALLSDRITDDRLAFATECAERCRRAQEFLRRLAQVEVRR